MAIKILRKLQSLHDRQEKFYLIDLKCDDPTEDEELLIKTVEGEPDFRQEFRYALLDSKNEVKRYLRTDELDEIFNIYTSFAMFGRTKRSQFSYWFAHWCAFQMTALNFGVWRPKFLLHDIEKPWKLMIFKDYKKVQMDHRTSSSHHTEYGIEHGWENMDWLGAVIDWECSRFTKRQAQMNARETLEWLLGREKWKPYEKEIRAGIEPILHELGL